MQRPPPPLKTMFVFPIQACKDHGFFYLENHGVPEEMMQQVFDQSKAFFELDIKLKMTAKANEYNRGYRPMGSEMIDKKKQSKGDTKVWL